VLYTLGVGTNSILGETTESARLAGGITASHFPIERVAELRLNAGKLAYPPHTLETALGNKFSPGESS
jgi:hypothetical protein